jgi:hypothetical protein
MVATNSASAAATNSAAKKANSAANTVKNAVKGVMSGDKTSLMIVIAITVLLFIFVIIYITFAMKSSSLKGKMLNGEPLDLAKQDRLKIIKGADIPATAAGREYTYSTWIYLENIVNSSSTAHPVIMYRGDSTSLSSANPIFFMGANTNKLYVAIDTTTSTLTTSTLDDILKKNWFTSNDPNLTFDSSNRHIIMTVDYVPLQRWVNVVLVVDNKMLTLYLDGELYSVKSVDEYKKTNATATTRGFVPDSPVIEKTSGDIIIGKNATLGLDFTIDGFLGKVEFFNYALNNTEVRKAYESGPLAKSWLSWLGITQYGVRSPVYKLNQAQ